MNIEKIQTYMEDIRQLRDVSSQNEREISNKGWRGEKDCEGEMPVSSLKVRCYLAFFLFLGFLWADSSGLTLNQYSTKSLQSVLSYNLTFEDMQDFCYTNGVENIIKAIAEITEK